MKEKGEERKKRAQWDKVSARLTNAMACSDTASAVASGQFMTRMPRCRHSPRSTWSVPAALEMTSFLSGFG